MVTKYDNKMLMKIMHTFHALLCFIVVAVFIQILQNYFIGIKARLLEF